MRNGARRIVEQPFRSIVNEEWKRSKKLLPNRLKKKPTFRWMTIKKLKGSFGRCWTYWGKSLIGLREGYMKLEDHTEFRHTIRHEIAHVADPKAGHGPDFMFFLERLEGTRYVPREAAEVIRPRRKKK